MGLDTNKRVAVIGLGAMGGGMAANLLRAGHDVVGVDPVEERRTALADIGGSIAATPAEAATGADIVVGVVVNAAQVESVLFGQDGAADALREDAVFVSCSTVPPQIARDFGTRLEEAGGCFLDAPISGGMAKAVSGELTVMASGSPAAFARAEPAFDAVAARVFRVGDAPGLGSAIKMINQHLTGIHVAATCEAMTFGIKVGLDPKVLYEVICNASGRSWMFENRAPRIIEGDYSPAGMVDIFVKDLGIVTETARSESYSTPVADAALAMFRTTSEAGLGREDAAALARTYAKLAGIELPNNDR